MPEKTKYLRQIELDFVYIVSEDRGKYTLKSESPFPEWGDAEIGSSDQILFCS